METRMKILIFMKWLSTTAQKMLPIASRDQDHTNVWIVDQLPREVDFISADPADATYGYDLFTHTYTWYLPTLDGYDPNDGITDPNTYFHLTVRVNPSAEPSSEIVNEVYVESDQWDGYAKEYTPICCWGPDVIYVDKNAPGYTQIGVDWSSAYTDLQDALARAERGCRSVIWIADGEYPSGDEESDTFAIPAGVSVYGGFAGYGAANPDKRDPNVFATVLSGYIGIVDEVEQRNNTVVTMGDDTLLDGCVVEEGDTQGIYVNGAFCTITSCIVKENNQWGINSEDSNLQIKWCKIYDNTWQGIWHEGSSYSLNVENCKIYDNERDGIYILSSSSDIINSVIYQNGSGSSGFNYYYGINLVNSTSGSNIRNNTIVHNTLEGIRRAGGSNPSVKNNIVYYNNDNGTQLVNISPIYCCIQNWTSGGTGNFSTEPKFAYNEEPYGYYHLNWDSDCREGGDSGNYPNEQDMDGQERVHGTYVDIGADEVDCEDTSDPNDWTADGVINYEEFTIFSSAWLSTDPNTVPPPKDPDDEHIWYVKQWGPKADMDHDSTVGLSDLELFLDNWLWEACWRQDYMAAYNMMSGGGSESMMMTMPMMQALETTSILKPDPKTLEENIPLVLDEIEKAIEGKHPNLEGLYEIQAFLKGVLWDLGCEK